MSANIDFSNVVKGTYLFIFYEDEKIVYQTKLIVNE